MADDPAGVGDLGHIAGAFALVGTSAMPDLVVEDEHRAGRPEPGDDLVLVGRALDWVVGLSAKQVRAGNGLRGPLCDLVDVGQHIVTGKEQYGQANILRRLTFSDEQVRRIVLVPGADAAAGWRAEAVVVDDMAG